MRPDLDKRYEGADLTAASLTPAEGGRLLVLPAAEGTPPPIFRVEQWSLTTGSPTTITAGGMGGPPVDTATEDDDYIGRALAHLQSLAPSLGLIAPGVGFVPDSVIHRTSAGDRIVHLHQQYRGVSVFETVRTVRFGPDGSLREVSGESVPLGEAIEIAPMLAVEDAVMAAAHHLEDAAQAAGVDFQVSNYKPKVVAGFPLPSRPTVLHKRPFTEPIPARLILFMLGPEPILGWFVTLQLPNDLGEYDVVVATNADRAGEVLYCLPLRDAAAARGLVFLASPGTGAREVIDFPADLSGFRSLTRPHGFPPSWVYDERTIGNNADSRFRGRALLGSRESGTLHFAPADPAGQDQWVLNAFYFANFLHDLLYLLGFDEVEGNFQRRNPAGVAGDRDEVLIRVFDEEINGIASMRSRRDGRNGELDLGRMPGTGRHTALDADLVFHEVIHGLTSRIVGGRNTFNPLPRHPPDQRGALGEGYSDYFALSIQNHQRLARGEREKVLFGDWVADRPGIGLREHGYDDAFPGTFGDLGTPAFTEPHDAGRIWCAALMRMDRRLTEALGDPFRGRELSWQLVVDSLKMLPSRSSVPTAPSFLDARDNIFRALDSRRERGLLDLAFHTDAQVALERAFGATGMGPMARSRGAAFLDVEEHITNP